MRLLILLLLVPAAVAQTVVTGTVLDGEGEPLPYATVLVVGTTDGAATNGQGSFAITTRAEGRQALEARYVGYAPSRTRLDLEGDTVRVTLRLLTELLDLEGAVVSADALAGTSQSGTGLTPLDVVTTPGASADLFQAVQTLAGLTQVDEGAGLFVRGGDVSETQILLDGLPLLQPYAFETPLGGTFGTVSPFLVRGTAFSTGAFSARYGDALSAVLALDSQDEPSRAAQTMSLSLAAASVGADLPIGDGGVRLAANQTFTDALFWVNGNGTDFASAPEATNASVVAAWPNVAGGRLKVLAQGTRDAVGVNLDEPSFQGVLTSRSGSGLGLATWRGPIARWQVTGSAGYSRYRSEQAAGSLRISPSDGALSGRVEGQRSVGRSMRWSVGLEGRRLTSRTEGTFSPDGVLDPAAETVAFDESLRAARGGAWVEAETQLSRRVVAQTGLRANVAADLGAVSFDPRVNVSVALSDRTQLRLAGGLYRQAPSLETLALTDLDLEVARATHAVVGVLHEVGDWTVRLEGYRK
ncbi:TonB-dependent receptor, partial [Rubrivirga sp.]|uniref:TonB-dependent receptor n=1 Tax=Rubrivirga sp. TaxID=1885344 RepID=UPI003C712818